MSDALPSSLQPVLTSDYPIRPRLLFLLQRREGVAPQAFEQALRRCREKFPAAVEARSVIARAGAAIAEEQQFIDRAFGALPVTPVDGYLAIDLESYEPGPADFQRLFAIAADCLTPARDVIDAAGSTAYAGIANLPIPGYAPLSMILILDRAAHLSLEQYNRWWVHHGHDHRQTNLGQAGYHQLHIAPEYNSAAAEAAGVSTSEQCIIDMMYLGSRKAAFSPGDPESAETKRISAEIGEHVGYGQVRGSFFREL